MMILAGVVTVATLGCKAKLEGDSMKKHILGTIVTFVAGGLAMAAVFCLLPSRPAQAPVASENDKFSMLTVPIQETGNIEAVFVLNHLTGVLVGTVINEQTGKFSHRYLRNVAVDFKTASKDPKYAIVTGPVNLRGSGGSLPAYGVIYIGELSSGAVIAYGFQRPSRNNAGATMDLVQLDYFQFADSVGQ